MAKKSGSNKLKRLAAPKMWDLERKRKRFVFKTLPGPYATEKSYPLGVIIRDLAHLTKNEREASYIVNAGKVLVDGKVRKSLSFPVGLFDTVSIPSEELKFRIVPSPKGLLLSKIEEKEADQKLCGINTKVMVRGGHLQYGLHDGRSLLSDSLGLAPGDAVLLEVRTQKVLDKVKLAKNSLALVLSGERAGQLGKVVDVKKGTITRERMVKVDLPSGEAEIPSRIVFPVGTTKPLITVGVGVR
ncbi:MAG: 30S ribosomal protein S4e [Thaumarchaeota archaeon]|nr:30S ribosomal protein S4e [Nitrososphaerota archaeon]